MFLYICRIRHRRFYVRWLGDDEQLISGLWVLRKIFTYAKLTVSACIVGGCIPTSYTPEKRVSQDNLVLDKI